MDLFDFVCLLRRLHLCGRVSHPSSFYSCSHVPSCLSPSTISCLPGPPGQTLALPTLKWRPAGDNSRSTKWDSASHSDGGRSSPSSVSICTCGALVVVCIIIALSISQSAAFGVKQPRTTEEEEERGVLRPARSPSHSDPPAARRRRR